MIYRIENNRIANPQGRRRQVIKHLKLHCIFIVLCSFLNFAGCKNSNHTSEYELVSRRIYEYKNFYNGNQLSKVLESAVNTGIDGSVLLEYSTEEIFFYDSRDSLERKESYEINADGEKILFAMEIYSDTTIQIVHFDAYKDTVFYNYRKKDQDGHIVEEYEFSRKPGISIVERELKVTSKYENGELKCSIFNDLTNKTNSVFRYEYKLEGDTVFTFEYENDQLVKKSRKSNSLNGNEIEINEFFNIGGVDSTFYYKNMVIRRIYRYSNRCTESTYEYDIPTYRSKMMLKSSVLLINTTFAANQSI